ncbi:alcohol dehydrogenase catalytic domain-containing protein [Arthrobacter sp. ATA002]|nr:alcohol dehydrogenase catalytic domain-containing protein [Arthrobacter sp. ATA002]WAP52207.1 alcohol dehydrogenase catalytic domain-containing protein [Arthrobacter sp. ATA002]
MTDRMKAVVLARFGGPDAFELREVPVPKVEPRQVRVRVHATALNPLDYQVRRGDYADYVPLPAITGHDISGVIEEAGSHVTEFRVGDEVYYTPQIFGSHGSYAEQHVADVELVGRKPENLNHLEAASLTLVGGTVWEALVTRAQLTVGEVILIHGGTGGVGTIAIQVAKAIGARVITTAKASDHAFLRSLGADAVIDYTSTDYVDAVAKIAQGKESTSSSTQSAVTPSRKVRWYSPIPDASSASSTLRSRRTLSRRGARTLPTISSSHVRTAANWTLSPAWSSAAL